jgi:hypothetical protein
LLFRHCIYLAGVELGFSLVSAVILVSAWSISALGMGEQTLSIAGDPVLPFTATPEEARRVAERHLEDQADYLRSEWREARLGEPALFRYVDRSPAVYVFPVIGKRGPSGYITVSAHRGKVPVIESADEGEAPGRGAREGTLVFVPPYTYSVMKYGQLRDLETSAVVSVSDARRITALVESAAPRSIASDAWHRYSTDEQFVQPMASYSRYISGVPNYTQRGNGCGHCAGAMLLAYWDKKGYPDLQSNKDDKNGSLLQQCLATDMGPPPVTFAAAEDGIEYHANNKHTHLKTRVSYSCRYHFNAVRAKSLDRQKNSWPGFKREIENKRPVMVYHDWWYPVKQSSYHWMTAVGYYENTNVGERGYYVNDCHGGARRYFNYDAYCDSISWLYVRPDR